MARDVTAAALDQSARDGAERRCDRTRRKWGVSMNDAGIAVLLPEVLPAAAVAEPIAAEAKARLAAR